MRRHPSQPDKGLPPELPLIHAYLEHGAHNFPERAAFIADEVRFTYGEAKAEIDSIAKGLLAAGIQKGDRVATLLPPCPQFFLIFLATASIGAIWVGLNPKYSRRELAHPLADCAPRLVLARLQIGDRNYGADIEAISGNAEIVGLDASLGADSVLAYSEFLDAGRSTISEEMMSARRADITPSDPCLIVYTSGTSGAPKGAMLTHQGLTYCGRTDAKYNMHAEGQKILCNFPINHIACVGDVCCTTLVVGGTIVFMESFDPDEIINTIYAHQITLLGQIPVMLHMTLSHSDFDPAKLASLKQIFWGGNPASLDLVKRLREICPNLSNVYGMTETTGNVLFARGSDMTDADLANTVGFAPPEYEVEIFANDGAIAAPGEVGEIHVRGPFVMAGYWNNEAATLETFTADGWLRTGDLATRTETGLISIVGRRSEMYKSGGYNVYPAEVEQAIETHPGVAMSAVIGVPDETYFEVGHAFVIAKDKNLTADDIKEHCKALLANYKVPKRFSIVSDLPLLANGKVDKKVLATQTPAT